MGGFDHGAIPGWAASRRVAQLRTDAFTAGRVAWAGSIAELQDLQQRVLQHDPTLDTENPNVRVASAPTGRSHNLPMPPTKLIDSEGRLELVCELLDDHRLLTLTGTGGVGKSRLAIEIAHASLGHFEAGVWLIELASVANADQVIGAAASTLGIHPEQGLSPLESVIDWFHGRELLLVLDNCEHVLSDVRELVALVLARCPTVKIVATSRESFGLVGEQVHSVNVLRPDVDGVALFLERAGAADSSFSIGDVDRDIVADICRTLDGLPLAIELAAARVRSMAPVDLLGRLDDRFKLLRSRDGADHHGTLLATVEWSYRLLSDHEQTIFDRLSVFAGGFDLRTVEVVCADDAINESDVIDLLMNLVYKSMVVVERHHDGTRYRVLETLRQFGRGN